jgi:hypothetical protein
VSEQTPQVLRRGELVLRASPGTPGFDATSEARKCGTNVTSSSCHPSSCLFSLLPFHLTPIPLSRRAIARYHEPVRTITPAQRNENQKIFFTEFFTEDANKNRTITSRANMRIYKN